MRREQLDSITAADVAVEGFPGIASAGFVAFSCGTHRTGQPDSEAIRIERRYLAGTA